MSVAGPSPLQIAKERLRIPALWELRGWPGRPGKSCKFPDGSDRSPSGSIFRDGLLLRDFRSGTTYDAPALLAAVENLTMDGACRLFIELAGITHDDLRAARSMPPAARAPLGRCDTAEERTKPTLPRLESGHDADLQALATLRAVSLEACRLARARGLLWFADSLEGRAWILADSERWNAIARRLDGQPWQRLSSKPKAKTLPGAWASWPIGLPEAANFPAIALVEGAPDFLAACHCAIQQREAERIAPVCMAGAGLLIPAECLPAFEGKRVRVFVHDDRAGRAAFERWAGQITEAGATVDGFDFSGLLRDDGGPVADLNDLCRIGPESWEQWRALVDCCMTFASLVPAADAFAIEAEHEQQQKPAAPFEREIPRAGCENDPLILRALELFGGRIVSADREKICRE